ncbi:MAG: amidophosphoribosyltransferase [Bacteroidales bacterium]|nr:amidophosphoribosyltransferase [Bacteroidales bacterium]MBD5223496.1 amidophosphoribosyltransferase [Bacteroidales bacterium]
MELLKHECGVAMVRLLKPLDYYQKVYGTWMYGLDKLYLLMEKQHNRGQEGAGLACVKMRAAPGEEFMYRERAEGPDAIKEIFSTVHQKLSGYSASELKDADLASRCFPFAGELYMGHLRYSTTGKSGLSYVHPFLRRNNWRAKNLCICANFNMTNVDEIFSHIAVKGQHPRMVSDTYLLLEQLGHRLDREAERRFQEALNAGLQDREITEYIEDTIDVANVLRESAPVWDGGYVLCGVTGSGEMFALRDPWGIRPAFWYKDEEVFVLASERPVIQTTLNVTTDKVQELRPGEAVIISKEGDLRLEQIIGPFNYAPCSFERVYFSRGSDRDIYRERKELGRALVQPILKAIDNDIDNTVFSYIPNTAEVAFYGMVQGFNEYLNHEKVREMTTSATPLSPERVHEILSRRIRTEKVALKDIKLRTFISEGASRNDLAAHVYDVTYGSLQEGKDNLVIIDDSIVRGTTLRESIIRILDRLHPRRIVIVSSSPQVRYPDYYGIDMSRMDEFIAFRAAVALAEERGKSEILTDIYEKCKAQLSLPKEEMKNHVKELYNLFTDEEISEKIVEILKPEDVQSEVKIVYQSLDGLHASCPDHKGDWYFSGNYPTPGGVRRINEAYINYIEEIYNKKQ